MTEQKSILVLGAGELGLAVLRQLAPRVKPGTVTVLVSPQSLHEPSAAQQQTADELNAMNVRMVAFDLAAATEEALSAQLRQFHTVINCTGFVAGPGTQMKLTRAALAAGVLRYFPWQFGVDYDVVGKGSGQPVFDEQHEVRLLLRGQAKTEWVIVSTGMFTSFLFEPATGLVDFDAGIVRGLGSWETQITVTTPEDIGTLTTAILLEEPRIVNRVVYVASDTVSYGQLADIVDSVTGRRFERQLLTPEMLAAACAEHPDDGMARYRLAFSRGDGMWWDKSTTYNAQRAIRTTDINTWLGSRRSRQ
ncbi:aromatic alcohol reductase [Janthinobacterium sp. PC23-8]|uniref:aromatic alcohol reductase n=1 Tax=Janthinobacterium sp. PC23-8 TaxID=2012679 RepID=UPI000B97C326|nr:aromatic alcohol reductase [Janthinobacterium sp. PC23-8]OYO28006.1 aromatic alcohol reductase [Janthinobacterium sp. PC23-8]